MKTLTHPITRREAIKAGAVDFALLTPGVEHRRDRGVRSIFFWLGGMGYKSCTVFPIKNAVIHQNLNFCRDIEGKPADAEQSRCHSVASRNPSKPPAPLSGYPCDRGQAAFDLRARTGVLNQMEQLICHLRAERELMHGMCCRLT